MPRLSWTACRDGFQCATARVPLDYDRPTGATIPVAMIRLPAASPGRRIGSLFLNPGGPGGSGVDFVRAVAQYLPLDLRGRLDIVGFDPRGVIRSAPLRCFATFGDALSALPRIPFPMTTRQESRWRAGDDAFAAACARRGGPILNHMSTADVARDLDLLREAVGDSALNYFGWSYGSMIGQTYANLFPARVRALAIDGVLDPVAWTAGRGTSSRTLPFLTRIGSAQGSQRTLEAFFRLCDAAGRNCDLAPGAGRRFAALAEQLRRHDILFPEPVGPPTHVTYAMFVGVTLGALYDPSVWPDLATLIKGLEDAAGPQDRAAAGLALSRLRGRLGGTRQEQYPNVVESFPGVACSDSVNPTTFAAWPRAAAAAERRYGYFGRPWTWQSSVCLPWPASAGQDRYLGPWSARTSAPVLVVGNYADPATPFQGARAAAHLLPNSRLLSYAGWGHTAFLRGNYCVDSAVTRYLVSTRLPAAGTVCQPAGSPFGPLPLRTAAAAGAGAALNGAVLAPVARRALAGS